MKKIILALTIMLILVVMVGANFKGNDVAPVAAEVPKKPCYGYTIIEFGKGINCDGDTIKLVKVNGGQQLMQHPEANAALTAKN
jgi:hypothetical protein